MAGKSIVLFLWANVCMDRTWLEATLVAYYLRMNSSTAMGGSRTGLKPIPAALVSAAAW